jgi:RNA recognition motif-containing protein
MEIFVSNIPFNTDAQAIRQLFEPYGSVGRVNIITDRETGR